MQNKIKVIGMFLPPREKQPENKIEDVNSVSQETENEVEKLSSELEAEKINDNKEPWLSFKLMT